MTDSWEEEIHQDADMPMEDESLESLEVKLLEYQESLQGIKAALNISPDEPELEKLAKDLQELVSLYEEMVEMKRRTEPKKRKVAHRENEIDDYSSYPVLPAVVSPEIPTAEMSEPSQTVTTPAVIDTTNLKSLLNRSCYAYFEGVIYTAIVVDVHPATATEASSRVTLEYIGWGNQETLPVNEVQFLPPVTNLTSGASCWAIHPNDGLWHLATVSRPDKESGLYFIRFKDSNESRTVNNDQVKNILESLGVSTRLSGACVAKVEPTGKAVASSSKLNGRPTREIVTPGGYRIPEKLTIKTQDSEKIKQMKKKKISMIKKEQRKELIEEDARQRQSTWRSHSQKAGKKRKQKESIFRTTDNPEGKVGVTGSGQKMTQFSSRSRHEYEEIEDEL